MIQTMAAPPGLFNGQIWRQLNVPCFEIMVLMLPRHEGEAGLTFCRAGTCTPPLVMTEDDGTWQYTEEALLHLLLQHNYTLVGEGRIEVIDRAAILSNAT